MNVYRVRENVLGTFGECSGSTVVDVLDHLLVLLRALDRLALGCIVDVVPRHEQLARVVVSLLLQHLDLILWDEFEA